MSKRVRGVGMGVAGVLNRVPRGGLRGVGSLGTSGRAGAWGWGLGLCSSALCAVALSACGGASRGASYGTTAQADAGPPAVGSSSPTANDNTGLPSGALERDTTPLSPPPPPPPRPVVSSLAKGDGSDLDKVLVQAGEAFDADDFTRAESLYRQAAQVAPREPGPAVGLARVAIAKTNLATDYNIAPKHPVLVRVVADLQKVVRQTRTFGPAYTELGRALLMLGRADEANEALRRAVELAPDDPEAHSALGVAMIATGRVGQAVDELSRAAALDPGSAPRQTNLGTALMMQGRTADALRAYEAASRIAPNDARILGDIGTALLADNQIDHAISVLQRAVELDPKRATLRSNLGYALQQRHDFAGAITQYREALALDDKLVSAWINLATASALTGDLPEAKKSLERARRVDPTDPRVKANWDELRALEQKRSQAPRGSQASAPQRSGAGAGNANPAGAQGAPGTGAQGGGAAER